MELIKIAKPQYLLLKDARPAGTILIGAFELFICSFGKEPKQSDFKQLERAQNALYTYDIEALRAYCSKWFKVDNIERALLFAANQQFPLSKSIHYIVKPKQ